MNDYATLRNKIVEKLERASWPLHIDKDPVFWAEKEPDLFSWAAAKDANNYG